MNNYERIKKMSVEELAKFLNKIVVNERLYNCARCYYCPLSSCSACDTEGIVEWLEREEGQ